MAFNPLEHVKRYQEDQRFKKKWEADFEIRRAKNRLHREVAKIAQGTQTVATQAAREAEKVPRPTRDS